VTPRLRGAVAVEKKYTLDCIHLSYPLLQNMKCDGEYEQLFIDYSVRRNPPGNGARLKAVQAVRRQAWSPDPDAIDDGEEGTLPQALGGRSGAPRI